MNRVTFEMLAKWIAEQSDAKILFDAQAKGACANMKTKEISMPCNLKEHNILAALALLMHEGGHLKISKKIPLDLVKGVVSHNVLNVMEDIRVDNHNFGILNNIRDFYERLIEDHVYGRKDEIAKEDLMTRCLINTILRATRFRDIDDKEANDFSQKKNVDRIIYEGTEAIQRGDWDKVKERIQKILDIFGVTKEQDYPAISGMFISAGKGEGKDGEDGKAIKAKRKELGNTDKYMRPGSAWDKGEGIKGPSQEVIGEVAFQDLTREAFKEILNIKEKRKVYEGVKLNSDDLTTFFTGNIEELFIDHDITKIKKSKISFCLDGSGSMGTQLLDGTTRCAMLLKTVRSIINILNELQETEGLNISYDIWKFDTRVEKLNHETWEKDYMANGGGTNLLHGFIAVQEDILNNQEIDGNKLVVLMTDGEVGGDEITELRNHIIKHGAEVKCMIVGIGSDLNGDFVKEIVGDNNIIASAHADSIVMDTIRTMLE